MKNTGIILSLIVLLFTQCTNQNDKKANEIKNINGNVIVEVQNALVEKYGSENKMLIKKGVAHTASLWRESDGDVKSFEEFCISNYISDADEKDLVFLKISKNLESLWGHNNKITLDLQENVHLDNGPLHSIDGIFASYSPNAHFSEDFYNNKIAFIISLNFPVYSLEEKTELGENGHQKNGHMRV